MQAWHGVLLSTEPEQVKVWKQILQHDLRHGNVDNIDWYTMLDGFDAVFDTPCFVSCQLESGFKRAPFEICMTGILAGASRCFSGCQNSLHHQEPILMVQKLSHYARSAYGS